MDDFDMDMTGSDGPQSEWDRLSGDERKELLRSVFDDSEWYDGPPYHEGGQFHPALGEIASKLGCKADDIKMYYAAWLKAKGFTADQIKSAIRNTPKTNAFADVPAVVAPLPESVPVQPSTAYQQQMDKMQSEAFSEPTPEETIMTSMMTTNTNKGDSVANSMDSMMKFMMMQQQIAAKQQHQQQMMMMEQRRLDQQREESLRREQQARDQQFSMQQMAFMREMMRTKDSDGFFDSDMKTIFKTKMIENLLDGGGGGESALERVAGKLLQPEILGAVASGAGAALSRPGPARPAGYDSPNYDPYATAQPGPQQLPPQQFPPQPMPETTQPVPNDMFFGEEEAPTEPSDSEQLMDAQPSAEEYKGAIMDSLKQQMGVALDDPKTLTAIQEQVTIAVDTVMVEYPGLGAEAKLNKMTEKIVLVRNLRDIAQGLQQATEELQKGTAPDAVYGYIIGQLKQNEVFWEIFRSNDYDQLLAIIHPFVQTGGVRFDYGFLSRDEVRAVCTELIARIHAA